MIEIPDWRRTAGEIAIGDKFISNDHVMEVIGIEFNAAICRDERWRPRGRFPLTEWMRQRVNQYHFGNAAMEVVNQKLDLE